MTSLAIAVVIITFARFAFTRTLVGATWADAGRTAKARAAAAAIPSIRVRYNMRFLRKSVRTVKRLYDLSAGAEREYTPRVGQTAAQFCHGTQTTLRARFPPATTGFIC